MDLREFRLPHVSASLEMFPEDFKARFYLQREHWLAVEAGYPHYAMGMLFSLSDDGDGALDFYDAALKFAKLAEDSELTVDCYRQIAIVRYDQMMSELQSEFDMLWKRYSAESGVNAMIMLSLEGMRSGVSDAACILAAISGASVLISQLYQRLAFDPSAEIADFERGLLVDIAESVRFSFDTDDGRVLSADESFMRFVKPGREALDRFLKIVGPHEVVAQE
ncbi:hypothetical protein HQ524_02580 [Candidatus Uhrbacteria bacterium]|nr:hypothetical protein [Candidatus Uhrbacteria bacterium]